MFRNGAANRAESELARVSHSLPWFQQLPICGVKEHKTLWGAMLWLLYRRADTDGKVAAAARRKNGSHAVAHWIVVPTWRHLESSPGYRAASTGEALVLLPERVTNSAKAQE
jgi:hypothetical protein